MHFSIYNAKNGIVKFIPDNITLCWLNFLLLIMLFWKSKKYFFVCKFKISLARIEIYLIFKNYTEKGRKKSQANWANKESSCIVDFFFKRENLKFYHFPTLKKYGYKDKNKFFNKTDWADKSIVPRKAFIFEAIVSNVPVCIIIAFKYTDIRSCIL